MGDPGGVGPEIIIKVLGDPELRKVIIPVVLGDPGVLEKACRILRSPLKLRVLKTGRERFSPGTLPVFPVSAIPMEDHRFGSPDPAWAKPVIGYIAKGVDLAKAGVLEALTTCPIHKETLYQAGFKFPGHTEFLAHLWKTRNFGMMLAGPQIKVSLVTIHVPYREVPECLTPARIEKVLELTAHTLREFFAIPEPRLALAGLNPHAGEGGRFGSEEEMILLPALKKAQKKGIRVSGPLPADSLFFFALKGAYDAVVALYHDQGLIPFKMIHFEEGVNITMGLPMIRTSVDHGTAFSLAGTGEASPGSLRAALLMAAEMIDNRGKNVKLKRQS
jgi:4-hydroxythreonine-4-phosphate dehydrogenase